MKEKNNNIKCWCSQVLQNFIPVYKPWYFSTEIILCQVSKASVPENKNFSQNSSNYEFCKQRGEETGTELTKFSGLESGTRLKELVQSTDYFSRF